MGGGQSKSTVKVPAEQLKLIVPGPGSFNKRAQFSDSDNESDSTMSNELVLLVEKELEKGR